MITNQPYLINCIISVVLALDLCARSEMTWTGTPSGSSQKSDLSQSELGSTS